MPFFFARLRYCQVSSSSSLAARFASAWSFASDACAPYEQQPCASSGAASVRTPWHPLPKMQLQCDVRNVTSTCQTCFLRRGSGKVTHSRTGPVALLAFLPVLLAL